MILWVINLYYGVIKMNNEDIAENSNNMIKHINNYIKMRDDELIEKLNEIIEGIEYDFTTINEITIDLIEWRDQVERNRDCKVDVEIKVLGDMLQKVEL